MFDHLYLAIQSLDRWRKTAQSLPFPVLSIGNVSMGGRAKTPVVIWACQQLMALGIRPIVLSRGYGRTQNYPVWIEGPVNSGTPLNADQSGDEPLEIFYETAATVLVGANRYENALNYLDKKNILKNQKSKIVFILDDGFQHWSLKRDLDWVLIEKSDNTAKVFPYGPLREPITALNRAQRVLTLGVDVIKRPRFFEPPQDNDVFLTTRANKVTNSFGKVLALNDHANAQEMKKHLRLLAPGTRVWVGRKEAVKLFGLQDYQQLKIGSWNNFESIKMALVDLDLEFAPTCANQLIEDLKKISNL